MSKNRGYDFREFFSVEDLHEYHRRALCEYETLFVEQKYARDECCSKGSGTFCKKCLSCMLESVQEIINFQLKVIAELKKYRNPLGFLSYRSSLIPQGRSLACFDGQPSTYFHPPLARFDLESSEDAPDVIKNEQEKAEWHVSIRDQ